MVVVSGNRVVLGGMVTHQKPKHSNPTHLGICNSRAIFDALQEIMHSQAPATSILSSSADVGTESKAEGTLSRSEM